MSEYQYYEFRAIDQPLTEEQRVELRSFSTRAQITRTSFVNEYNWGSFKGDPDDWMERYFDAFLYVANWGTRHLRLRVPKKLLPLKELEPYCSDESFNFRTSGPNCILSYESEEEEPESVEGDGWLSSLISLRTDLLQGDFRCLYFGWLLAVQHGERDDSEIEPSVPPNLQNLNGSLQTLIDFLRLDEDLIIAATEQSLNLKASSWSRQEILNRVRTMPSQEKDDILVQLLESENPHLGAEFRQRLLKAAPAETSIVTPPEKRRTIGDLRARAEALRNQRLNEEKARRDRADAERTAKLAHQRQTYLESLIGREKNTWNEIERLIGKRQPGSYKQAITLMTDLRDLAEQRGGAAQFSEKLKLLIDQHTSKPAFIQRLNKARLC